MSDTARKLRFRIDLVRKHKSAIAGLSLAAAGFLFIDFPIVAARRAALFGIDSMNPVKEATNTLEIVHEGHDKRSLPVLSIHKALGFGFDEVFFGTQKYQRAAEGEHAYFRQLAAGQRPRYRFTEKVIRGNDSDSRSWPNRGDIRIIVEDTHTKKEVGRWHGPGPGWAGDQAGHFAAAVLQPKTKLRVGEPKYPVGTAVITEPGTFAIDTFPAASAARDCPPGYAILRDEKTGSYELRTSTWTFGVLAYPDSVLCSNDGVFVFRNYHWAGEAHAYWLSYDGKLLGVVHSKIPGMASRVNEYRPIISAVVIDGKLNAKMAYFSADAGSEPTMVAYKELSFVASIVRKPK